MTVSLAFTFIVLAIVIGLLGDVSEKSGSVVMQKAQESGQWSQPAGDQIETETPTGN